jgi:beta-xylosidase
MNSPLTYLRHLAALLSLAAISIGACNASAQVFYKNPVIAGDHPDPSVIRVGKEYWASSTASAWGPLFPLLRSTDLVNWELIGAVLPHRPDWATGDFWAPEISEFKGRYYVYYVARKRGGPLSVAVATADKPGGPYTDHGPLVGQEDGSIDAFPVTDTNSVRYLVWKEDGNSRRKPTPIWAQRLNDDGTKLVGEMHELISNDNGWEGGVVEGPCIIRHNDWFYLFYSGNGCCGTGCNYALGVARSRSLLGPWEKNPLNPILAGNETWKCPGHGTVVTDPDGRFWLLYHAYSTTGSIFTGREGMLDEVKFGTDGWPTINANQGPSRKAPSPFGTVQKASGVSYTDDFNGDNLESGWQWPQHREPVHLLKDGKLLLSVIGQATNFISAVLARSTTAADYVATTVIEARQLKPGVAAGLCAFGNVDNALGAVLKDGNVILWRRDKGVTHQMAQQPTPHAEKIFLRLTARHGYSFQLAVSADGEKWMPCGDAADAKDLPPWDLSVRVALTVGGTADAEGSFDSFSIKPLESSTEK